MANVTTCMEQFLSDSRVTFWDIIVFDNPVNVCCLCSRQTSDLATQYRSTQIFQLKPSVLEGSYLFQSTLSSRQLSCPDICFLVRMTEQGFPEIFYRRTNKWFNRFHRRHCSIYNLDSQRKWMLRHSVNQVKSFSHTQSLLIKYSM